MIPLLAAYGEQTLDLREGQATRLALSSIHLSGHTVQDHLKKGFKNISLPLRQHKRRSRKTRRHKSYHLFTVASTLDNSAVAGSYSF